tara:strand:+ start:309 stop:896 length:588 start_codon:yes stop_codon:yes gene_type:complete
MGGIGMAKAASSAYGKEQDRKNNVNALNTKKKALENLANVTPSERRYVRKKREIAAKGDPLLKAQSAETTQAIKQVGSDNRMASMGQSVSQGLENSVVAQELRRRVDKDTLSQVAKEARMLAAKNAKAKQMAELDIEKMNMKTDDRRRDVNYKKGMVDAEIAGVGGYDRWGTLANVALAGVESGVDAYGVGWEDE